MDPEKKDLRNQQEILIVDDVPANLELLSLILSNNGYRVRLASNGQMALDYAAERAPDMILLDIKMPDMDGYEVCRRLKSKKQSHKIPVLFISGLDDTAAKLKGFSVGGVDYIAKPFETEEVLARVGTHLRLRELTDFLEQKVHERTTELTEANLKLRQEIGERRRAETQIRLLNDELEKRVQERTNELAGSLAFIRATLESTAEGIIAINNSGEITYINNRFVEMLQLPEDFSTSLDTAQLREIFYRHLKEREKFIIGEKELAANPEKSSFDILEFKDGRTFERCSKPQRIEDKIIGRVWSYRDITKRQELEDQLRQAHKMEAVGRLAAGIAHEINSPMQFLNDNIHFIEESVSTIEKMFFRYQGMGQAIKEGAIPADLINQVERQSEEAELQYLFSEIPDAIRQSLEGTDRVSKIVRALKEFSLPAEKEKKETNINKAIEDTVLITRNEWKYIADTKLKLDPRLPPVPCYLAEFNQVMLNLIVNAAQAVGKVVDKESGTKGLITISTRAVGNSAEIRVSDTGPGITDEVAPHIFEPFFTTKDVGHGTGQGLSMVYRVIVNQHEGTARFESKLGQGTTFILTLPLLPL